MPPSRFGLSAHRPATVLRVPQPRIPVLLLTSVLTPPPKSCATLGPIVQQAPQHQYPAPQVPIAPTPSPSASASSPSTALQSADSITSKAGPAAFYCSSPSTTFACHVLRSSTSVSSTSRLPPPAPSVPQATTPAPSAQPPPTPFALDALPEPTTPRWPTPPPAPHAGRAPLASTMSTSSPPATPPPTSPAPYARSEATVETPPPPLSWPVSRGSIVAGSTASAQCPNGLHYSNASAKIACPSNCYSGSSALTNCSVCCPGTYRSVNCSATANTVWPTCTAGSTFINMSNAASCNTCPGQHVGTACTTSSDVACSACAAGIYCPSSSLVIPCIQGQICPAGSTALSKFVAGCVLH